MSKLIAQVLLSLVVSLGLAVGVNPNVRGDLKNAVKDVKAFVSETTEYAFASVNELTSQADADVDAVNADIDEDIEANGSTETGGASSSVSGGADVTIEIGLGIGE